MTIVSVGYSCLPKLVYLHQNIPSLVFDWVGTSVWSITRLIQNDFEKFLDISRYEKAQITSKEKIVVHKDYYVRIPHYVRKMHPDEWKKFTESFERKIQRTIELFNSGKEILLLRYQDEYGGTRLEYPSYQYENELEQMRILLSVLSNKYKESKFYGLYLSHTENENTIDHSNSLVCIKLPKKARSPLGYDKDSIKLIKTAIKENIEILKEVFPPSITEILVAT